MTSHDPSPPAGDTDTLDRKVARGAAVNVLGTVAKSLHPLFLILATRLFGPEVVGLYLVATAMLRFVTGFATAGYRGGIVMMGGRHAHTDDEAGQQRLYGAFANALVITLAVTAAVIAAAVLAGPAALRLYNAEFAAAGLADAVVLLTFALPFMAITELTVAATRALLIMRYDTIIIGFLRPALLVVCALVAWAVRDDLIGLVSALVATEVMLAVVASVVFTRHFSVGRLVGAIVHFRFDRELTSFAIPQSLNMTLSYFMSDIDLLMLGLFKVSPGTVALYGIAAQIVRNIRQIKLAFSGIFAPLIARLHAAGRIDELEERFMVVSRWAITYAIPVAFVVLSLRRELLALFHPDLGGGLPSDTRFMVILTVVPLLSCAFGLAGNIVVMTGHSRWNLFNSLVVGGANVGLNWVLIPRMGVTGAALASVIAAAAVTVLQIVEARMLVGVRLRLRLLAKPLIAGALGTVALLAVWALAGAETAVAGRVGAVVVSVAVFAVALRAFGIDPRDRAVLPFGRGRSTQSGDP